MPAEPRSKASCECSTSPGSHCSVGYIDPILRVADMERSVRFYVDVLGFTNAPWGSHEFSHVSRDGRGIYLSSTGQGQVGAWVWIGVDDVEPLHEDLVARGIAIRLPPTRYPWAREIHVEDPDGNVLRFGSDPDPESGHEA